MRMVLREKCVNKSHNQVWAKSTQKHIDFAQKLLCSGEIYPKIHRFRPKVAAFGRNLSKNA